MMGQWDYNEKAEADIRPNNESRIMKCNYNSTFVRVPWVITKIVD
jgi:hypothetical protein